MSLNYMQSHQRVNHPKLISGRIIGLFRLSYLTPGLMAAGVTEVVVDKDDERDEDDDDDTSTEDNDIGSNAIQAGSGHPGNGSSGGGGGGHHQRALMGGGGRRRRR